MSAKHFTLNEHQLSLLKTRELPETMEGQRRHLSAPQAPPLGEHGLGGQQPSLAAVTRVTAGALFVPLWA